MRLLVIEGNLQIAEILKISLEKLGYRVDLAHDGHRGLSMACSGGYQLILLDRMLPGPEGPFVLERLRQGGHRTPLILLSASGQIHERVKGLRAGADDFLTRPFAFVELSARVEAVLRRSYSGSLQDVRRVGDLKITYSSQSVRRLGQPIELTQKEFHLLCLLAERPKRLVTRTELIQRVWGPTFEAEDNVIDVTMRRLRRKMDAPFPVKLIRTVRGVGFILEPGEERV